MEMRISRRKFLNTLGALGGAAIFSDIARAVSYGKDRTAFNFLVLGDSLVWGQGLKEEQKFYTLTKQWISEELLAGSRPVALDVRAHSGSTIMLTEQEASALLEADRDTGTAVHPEINVSFPSIRSQVAAAREENPAPENVDLIMLSGGVPEVGVANIVNPFQGNERLRTDIRRYCYEHMSSLLEQAADAFPNALIAVIGYYPIITRYTPVKRIVNDILEIYNWPGWTKPVINNPVNRLLWRRYRRKMIERSRIWYDDSSRELQRAVNALNVMTGKETAVLIKPPFGEENGYGAKNTLLWKVAPRGRAADPLKETRKIECRQTLEELRRETNLKYRTRLCELASVGHPNEQGAAAIAEAIKKTLRPILTERVALK